MFVEVINLRVRRVAGPVHLHEPSLTLIGANGVFPSCAGCSLGNGVLCYSGISLQLKCSELPQATGSIRVVLPRQRQLQSGLGLIVVLFLIPNRSVFFEKFEEQLQRVMQPLLSL